MPDQSVNILSGRGRPDLSQKKVRKCHMPKIVTDADRANMRRQIIGAAAEEFSQVGFDQARMESISERAEIGKGTIYLYFKSKEALFSEMLEEVAREQLFELRSALEQKKGFREKLNILLATFNRLALEQPEGFRIFISSLYGVNRRFKDEAAKHARGFLRLVEDILKEARENGEVQVEVEPAALLILNAGQFLVLMSEAQGFEAQFVQLEREKVVTLLMEGLG
jgi:TetR/AcrR family fatty acid metabolism transcriptional regulator